MKTVLDLYCGVGGFSVGFIKAGFKVKYAIDNDKRVKETFEANHSDTEFILSSVEDLNPEDFSDVNILIGGPPCQPFSVANAKADPEYGMGAINEFYRWKEVIKPEKWIMENVEGVLKYLSFLKYPEINVLNCANYGVPQTRRRCFSGNYCTPNHTHKKDDWITVEQAIGDILFEDENLEFNHNVSEWKPISEQTNKKYMKAHKALDLFKPSRTITAGSYKDGFKHPNFRFELPRFKVLNARSFDNKAHKPYNDSQEPNQCVTTTPPKLVIEKWYRRVTARELARLQSFDDDFIFYGSLSAQYRMIGNAVPPLMAYQLAKSIYNKKDERGDSLLI